MGSRTKASTPQMQARADQLRASSPLAAIVRLTVADDRRLNARPIDAGNDYSRSLARAVTSLYGKSKRVDQESLRKALGGKELAGGVVLIVAEEGPEATDDLVRLLNELIADPTRLTDDGMHTPLAGLVRWGAVSQPVSGVLARDVDIHNLAFVLHRRGIVGPGQEERDADETAKIESGEETVTVPTLSFADRQAVVLLREALKCVSPQAAELFWASYVWAPPETSLIEDAGRVYGPTVEPEAHQKPEQRSSDEAAKDKPEETVTGPGQPKSRMALLDSEDPSERKLAAVSLADERIDLPELRQMAVSKLSSLLMDPFKEVALAAFGTLQRYAETDGELEQRLATLAGLLGTPALEQPEDKQAEHRPQVRESNSLSDETLPEFQLDALRQEVRQIRERRSKIQEPALQDVRAFLARWKGRSLKSLEENQELAEAANDLAAEAGCVLQYNGQTVTVECFANGRTGDFRLRVKGMSNPIKRAVTFPDVEAHPLLCL